MRSSQRVYGSIKNDGFTLVEILIVLVIVVVLSGLILLISTAVIDKSKETTCIANRKIIEKAYIFYKLNKSNPVMLEQFIADGSADSAEWTDKMGKCPSGGIYTASTDVSGTKDILLCSVHDNTAPPTPDPDNMIPGTNMFGGSSGILATDNWDACVTEHNISFAVGQKFLYNGEFYVATTQESIWYNTNSDPSQNAWWTTSSTKGLVQITDVSQTWDNVSNGDTFVRGDLLYYNGDYYVCKVGGNGGVFTVSKSQWNNNPPDSDAGKYAWYKLD